MTNPAVAAKSNKPLLGNHEQSALLRYVGSMKLLTGAWLWCTGKYALSNLVGYLPAECRRVNSDDGDQSSSNETLCAVISTLCDLVADSTRTTKYVATLLTTITINTITTTTAASTTTTTTRVSDIFPWTFPLPDIPLNPNHQPNHNSNSNPTTNPTNPNPDDPALTYPNPTNPILISNPNRAGKGEMSEGDCPGELPVSPSPPASQQPHHYHHHHHRDDDVVVVMVVVMGKRAIPSGQSPSCIRFNGRLPGEPGLPRFSSCSCSLVIDGTGIFTSCCLINGVKLKSPNELEALTWNHLLASFFLDSLPDFWVKKRCFLYADYQGLKSQEWGARCAARCAHFLRRRSQRPNTPNYVWLASRWFARRMTSETR